jgi:hypothetical protein
MTTDHPGQQFQIGGIVIDLVKLADAPGALQAVRSVIDAAFKIQAKNLEAKVLPLKVIDP